MHLADSLGLQKIVAGKKKIPHFIPKKFSTS